MANPVDPKYPFLSGGGEMGARVRAFDWSSTPLGPIDGWSPVLKTSAANLLASPLLGTVLWGPDLRLIYNDTYAPALAERHPHALGQPIADIWGDVWEQIRPMFMDVFVTGEAAERTRFPVPMSRHGQREVTFWNVAISAIRDEAGTIVGLHNYAIEITAQVRAEALRAEAEDRLLLANSALRQDVASGAAALTASEAKLGVSEAALGVSEAALLDERATAELREQFIAVLGHDLRNPLSAISGAAYLIAKTPLTDKAAKLAAALQSSVVRMTGLIDNVLDFARGRLGSGLTLSRDLETGLEATLRQAVDELRIIAPERAMEAEYHLAVAVECDRARIAQLFSNLLGNALTHGAPEKPIHITAKTTADEFVLKVCNGGAAIAPAALDRLFQPFYRGAVRPSQQGLGLGLFIASEIARAHAGTLTVTSDDAETCFTLRMPLRQVDRPDLERPA